jgi:hypothetical protein
MNNVLPGGKKMKEWKILSPQKVVLLLVLSLVLLTSVTGIARSIDELVRLASFEAFPEIRQAAAIALVPDWVVSQESDENLRELAETGLSAELRSAAAQALGIRLAEAALDEESLITLILSADFVEILEAAAAGLEARLLVGDFSIDELTQFAVDSRSELIRKAAVTALASGYSNSQLSDRALNDIVSGGATAEVRLAAAQALASRITLNTESLLELVDGGIISLEQTLAGSNPELRMAAQPLYAQSLANADLEVELLIEMAGDTTATSELRSAAGEVLAEKLLQLNLPLDQLEVLSTGATSELRNAAHTALVIATVGGVGSRLFSLSELAGLVAEAESVELAEARAEAVLVLLRGGLSSLDGQDDLELIANGGTAVVNGVIVNGGERAFRIAASDFLVGIYTFFGFIDRFADPLTDLTAIAENPELTVEWRSAAGVALSQVYRADSVGATFTLNQLENFLDELLLALGNGNLEIAGLALDFFTAQLEIGRDSIVQTAEVAGDFTVRQRLDDIDRSVASISQDLEDNRPFAISSTVTSIQNDITAILRSVEDAPNVMTTELWMISVEGATSEIRSAAGNALSFRFERDLPDLESLLEIARVGVSPELREAVIPALTNVLVASEFSQEELIALSEDDFSQEVRLAAARALFSPIESEDYSPDEWAVFINSGELAIGSLNLNGSNPELRAGFGDSLTTQLLELPSTTDSLVELSTEGTTAEIRIAAASALSTLYAQLDGPMIDELIELAGFDDSPDIQRAAGIALESRLIEEEQSEGAIVALIAQNSIEIRPGAASALGDGLAEALAHRFITEEM